MAAYRSWRDDSGHPGVPFKKVGIDEPLYSARINDNYRAAAYVRDGVAAWFWIGTHAEYERLLDG